MCIKIGDSIMDEVMKRFYRLPEDCWGQTVITDIENTEPVCIVFSKYHPYAPDVILNALNQKYPEIVNQGENEVA